MEHLIEISNKIVESLEEIKSLKVEMPLNSDINISDLELLEKNYFILNQVNNKIEILLKNNKIICNNIYDVSKNFRQQSNKFHNINNNNRFIQPVIGDSNELSKEYFKNMSLKIIKDREKNKIKIFKTIELVPNFSITLPVINNLKELKPSFVWYIGNSRNKEGIYMSLGKVLIQVPFPDLISKNSPNFKYHSMPCKNHTVDECRRKLEEIARIKKTEIRTCTYAHIGENYYKIGSDFRAPLLPQFGSHDSLDQDLKNVQLFDIKNILMNATSDLLLIKLWADHNKNLGNIVFDNLDIV